MLVVLLAIRTGVQAVVTISNVVFLVLLVTKLSVFVIVVAVVVILKSEFTFFQQQSEAEMNIKCVYDSVMIPPVHTDH